MEKTQSYTKGEKAMIDYYENLDLVGFFKSISEEKSTETYMKTKEYIKKVEDIAKEIDTIPCSQERVAMKYKIARQIQQAFDRMY